MKTEHLVDRLAAHRALAGVPREELQWLASHGRLRQYAAGEVVSRRGDPMDHLYVVLSGHISISLNRGAGSRKGAEWRGGDVTGFLPYSRLQAAPGNSMTEESTEVLMVHCSDFPEMVRECNAITSVLVHVMLDRARLFTSNDLHDEKMRSLGVLAAGLAHELNNPASAVGRSAKSLASCLVDVDASACALGSAGLSSEQLAVVNRLRDTDAPVGTSRSVSPIEVVEREDAVAAWLDRHQVDSVEADALAEVTVSLDALDQLAAALDGAALPVALRYLGAISTARKLTLEIETGASRIHELVTAVKGFAYMDQATAPKPVDVSRGLSDTLTVHRAKARAKAVDLRLEIEPGLPPLEGFGGELNQVWGILIDNAIDAVSEAGHVTVTAARDHQTIVVRVVDDGPGIPEQIRARIFEPFFTTKRVGEGTGLGLSIARRLIERHNGAIDVSSVPGCTEFRVTLPIAAPVPGAGA